MHIYILTHWGRVTHICVSRLTIIGSDNGLPPDRRQAIIWTNAGILLIGPLGTNFSEISIEIPVFSFKKMRFKVSSAKRRPFCLGLNVLTGKNWMRCEVRTEILCLLLLISWWSCRDDLNEVWGKNWNFVSTALNFMMIVKRWQSQSVHLCPLMHLNVLIIVHSYIINKFKTMTFKKAKYTWTVYLNNTQYRLYPSGATVINTLKRWLNTMLLSTPMEWLCSLAQSHSYAKI